MCADDDLAADDEQAIRKHDKGILNSQYETPDTSLTTKDRDVDSGAQRHNKVNYCIAVNYLRKTSHKLLDCHCDDGC